MNNNQKQEKKERKRHSVSVEDDVKKALDKLKPHPRATLNEVIRALLMSRETSVEKKTQE